MENTDMIFLSLLFFACGIITMVFTIKKEHGFTNKVVARLIVFLGLALYPLYLMGSSNSSLGGHFDILVSSLLGIIRAVTGENSLSDTREAIGSIPEEWVVFFANYTALLHLLVSALVLSFVLNLFKNYLSAFSYTFIERGKLCIFTELSERSLHLANDIRQKEKEKSLSDCTIVFLANVNEKDRQSVAYAESLKSIGAHIFDMSLKDFKIKKRYFKGTACFFLLKENEEDNLRETLVISDKYGKKNIKGHLQIHVLTSTPEAVAIVDSIEYSPNISIRIFNESKAMIYNLFDKHPLFLAERENKLKILVIGGGRIGLKAVKVAAWCAQTINIRPEIIIVDNDPSLKERFAHDCPELHSPKNGDNGKPDTCIKIYTQDVQSDSFYETMLNNRDVGYVICALGDEELNLRTALNVRGFYEKVRFSDAKNGVAPKKPYVHLLLNNSLLYDISGKLKFSLKAPCDLHSFGSLKELYTWENVVSPYLDSIGMASNRFYARCQLPKDTSEEELKKIEAFADKDYEDVEYRRNSSMALGLHAKYKLYAALTEIGGKTYSEAEWRDLPSIDMIDELSKMLKNEKNIELLSILEHRRWNNYMRSEGWQKASFELADSWYGVDKHDYRNFASRQNVCIILWDELDSIDEWMLKNHNSEVNIKKYDCDMVKDLAIIITQAKDINRNLNAVKKNKFAAFLSSLFAKKQK